MCTGKVKVCFVVLIKLSLRLINPSYNPYIHIQPRRSVIDLAITSKQPVSIHKQTSKQSVSMHKRTSKQSVSERETSKQLICLHNRG